MGEKKKPEEGEPKTEDPKTEKHKNPEKEQKTEEGKANEKASKDDAPTPPPPPPEIVLRVYMHCEGCARKVRRCLKGFDGVEEVVTDCRSQKVVVKGEKADPQKVLDRVQKKTHRQVELLSPLPPPKANLEGEEEKKAKVEDEKKKEEPKPEAQEKKEEPKVISVVIKVHMHCEACSLEIKRRIEKMNEVEEAIPDLISSTVSVKGTFDPPKLIDYVYKRTGKHASIVQITPPKTKADDNKGKDGKDENKGGGDDAGNKEEKKEKGSDVAKVAGPVGDVAAPEEAVEKAVELKRNEYNYNPPRYGVEMYAYPPQIFSDENPNACSIM